MTEAEIRQQALVAAKKRLGGLWGFDFKLMLEPSLNAALDAVFKQVQLPPDDVAKRMQQYVQIQERASYQDALLVKRCSLRLVKDSHTVLIAEDLTLHDARWLQQLVCSILAGILEAERPTTQEPVR